MELDLDAFLQSHDTSTSDDEDDHHHRSTVDELLLIDSDDDDGSSSSDNTDANSSDYMQLTTSQLGTDGDRPSKFRSTSQSETFSQLPRLFRSNAKPGAALAAAAAASRLIPTPHAAAIKLTREKSGTETLDPKPEIGHLDVKLVDDDLKPVELTGNSQLCGELITEHKNNSAWSLKGEVFSNEELATDVADASEVDGFDLDFRDDTLSSAAKPEIGSDKDGARSVLDDTSNDYIEGNSAPTITVDYIEGQDMDAKEDSVSVSSGKIDAENLQLYEKGVEHGFQAEVDDRPAQTVDMGGIVIHQGSDKSDGGTQETLSKPLEFAEELEKKHAFTGLHWEEGAAAQPMKLEGVHTGSTALAYFSTSTDNTITRTISSPSFRRDHGTPQALAVHLNYIAVGMSRGLIVVVPSKYSPHYADNMDAKMLMLGLQGDRSYAPVTSMSFNHQGDLLFAGYADGHYTVWDVQRVTAAKVVAEHKAPVVHMLYLGMDSQVARQFNMVSGDSKGVVKSIRFSPSSWLSRFSTSKTSTLLDESTSTVVCASPLVPEEKFGGSSASTSIESMMGGDLLSAEEGVVIFVTHQSALVAKVITTPPEVYGQLPKPDGVREGSMPYAAWKYIVPSHGSAAENVQVMEPATVPLLAIAWDNQVQVAKLVKSELKLYAKWTLDSSAIGIAWLDDQMLVVLTSAGQLCLYANDGTLIHDTSFAVDGGRGDDVIGHHTHFSNVLGKAHHNCIAVRGASLYLLGPTHLVVSRLLPWKERIEVLRRGGDWMGAFNMAMVLYDGQAHGVFDLPRALDDVRKVIMGYLVELLLAYVDEVFSYISVASGNQLEHLNDSYSVTSEQYTSVGGVAVEFCVHIKRTDILFDEILSRFESVKQKETFLELLEPYILKDMLGSLPPEIMQALVEHYSAKGWLQRVEQCVLHMDISSLDFNQVVRLCREHNLYRALIYLFNKGLDDFRTPLEELLLVFKNSDSENAPSLGYRMLVYLKYCFSGFAFPPGHGTLPPARLPSLRRELIHFLLEDSDAPSLTSLSAIKSYKNLYHLLELDTEATLDVLRCAFINESVVEKDSTSQNQDLTQKTVDVLVLVLETNKSIQPDTNWPSKDDIGHMLEFISHFVSCGEAKVSNEYLGQIFEYLILDASIPANAKIREKEVLALLKVVPQTDWDDRHLLDMCEKAHFYQVCGFIYNSRHQYIAALDSFMKDVDEPIHAFSYIHNLLSDKRLDYLEAAVISRIPDLVQISREGTFFLVVEHFFQEFQHILSELRTHPKSLFLYLKTVIEVYSKGTLSFSSLREGEPRGTRVKNETDDFLERLSEFPKSLRENPIHVTDEMTELYLELLCQYEPNSVLHFLETCESYRVDHCLRLCQEYKIIDGAAFLLERVGDVGSALSFTLSDLVGKFCMLDAAAAQSVDDYAGVDHFSEVMNKEVNDILHIVRTCVGLCQRNSSRLDPNESEALWFQLLDKFCEPLTDPCASKMDSEQNSSGSLKTTWKIRGSDKGALMLRKLFSIFIKEIVEGMIGYVRLPTVMMKLLSDNGSQEFGDFKPTILGMLGTYDFERRILDTARSLIEDDTYYTMTLLKRGASHGHGPQSLVCFICNCLVTKDSPSTTGIRVYSCGHASHLHCDPASHTGCPICMPKKKGVRSRGNLLSAESGLVSKALPKHKSQATGAVHLLPQEKDGLDRQISRYEILSNLDKDKKRIVQVDNMPQLRLAPPAVYQEKVKKGVAMLRGESSGVGGGLANKMKTGKQIKDLKTKGPAVRFPLKSNIFGKISA
ncbi:putative transcription factor WD40-like family [Helianthus annuus]|nr:putative transcription factor WD40-like family [Helianthus annuus]